MYIYKQCAFKWCLLAVHYVCAGKRATEKWKITHRHTMAAADIYSSNYYHVWMYNFQLLKIIQMISQFNKYGKNWQSKVEFDASSSHHFELFSRLIGFVGRQILQCASCQFIWWLIRFFSFPLFPLSFKWALFMTRQIKQNARDLVGKIDNLGWTYKRFILLGDYSVAFVNAVAFSAAFQSFWCSGRSLWNHCCWYW